MVWIVIFFYKIIIWWIFIMDFYWIIIWLNISVSVVILVIFYRIWVFIIVKFSFWKFYEWDRIIFFKVIERRIFDDFVFYFIRNVYFWIFGIFCIVERKFGCWVVVFVFRSCLFYGIGICNIIYKNKLGFVFLCFLI